jgi:hypothetical protein
VEPGVGRVIEADADHPAARAIEAFYADYLQSAAGVEDSRPEARLSAFEYADRDDVAIDMTRRVDALREGAGEEGMLADPFLCAESLPAKVVPVTVSELEDRVMIRMQAYHAESTIPQFFSVEAMAQGKGWQIAAVSCR